MSAGAAFVVYADATALIGLGRIGRLDLLTLLPVPILVTACVWDEVAMDSGKRGGTTLIEARTAGLLNVVEEADPNAFPQLDPGESTVLTAAAIAGAAVLIDERKARSLIARKPFVNASIREASGIVGLILLAKRRGRIATVQPLIDALIHENFWISPKFYAEILHLAGERSRERRHPG